MARLYLIALACLAPLAGCEVPDSARGAKSLFAVWTPPTPTEATEMALDPYNADARAKGVMLLANADFGGDDLRHRLYLTRIDDEDANVRAAALRGLALHARPDDAPVIVERLGDDNTRVRLEAARALQRVHNPVAIDALVVSSRRPGGISAERTGENEPAVRAEAVHALGQYAEPRVLLPLISAIDDRFLAVNVAAQKSLHTLTGQDFGLDAREWLAWYSETTNHFAGRQPYHFPVFQRDRFFWEYIPFVPDPPNEATGTPAGFPPLAAPGSPTAPAGNG